MKVCVQFTNGSITNKVEYECDSWCVNSTGCLMLFQEIFTEGRGADILCFMAFSASQWHNIVVLDFDIGNETHDEHDDF